MIEPLFAFCFDGKVADSIRDAGSPVFILPSARFSRPRQWVAARRQLRKLIERESVDCVVAHSPWALVLFGSAVRKMGRPLILWLHNPASGHWIDRMASRVPVDQVIANSRFTAASVPKMFPGAPVETILCPIDLPLPPDRQEVRRSLRRELGAADDAVVIVQISRMERWKGQDQLLEALGAMNEDSYWECWLAGGAQRPAEVQYAEELAELAKRLGLGGRVKLLGSRTNVGALLIASDIFCQPNREPEPFGMAIVEAMAAGLPVVTMNMGGASETVSHDCGILIAPGDIAGLAAALARLAQDAALRSSMGRSGQERARELCDPSQQLSALGRLLTYVVENGADRNVMTHTRRREQNE